MKLILRILLLVLLLPSCKKSSDNPPIDENVDLDGSKINDSSLTYPSRFLLSAAIPNPGAADLAKPVVIAVHGFSACTFEWSEFRDWSKTKGDFYVSVVLLGGHGRDYSDFKSSSWADWQGPIITEYNKLKDLGYKNINIVASSTGCPLVLNMIRDNKVSTDVLKHVFLIDPIIIPADKKMSLIPVLGLFVSYLKTTMEQGENGFWYKYRPAHAIAQLEKFARQERKALEKGYDMPSGVTVKVYKSKKDGSVDPASAVQLKKGLKNGDGSKITVEMVESSLHVFTRLSGRNSVSSDDKALQIKTFEEIHSEL